MAQEVCPPMKVTVLLPTVRRGPTLHYFPSFNPFCVCHTLVTRVHILKVRNLDNIPLSERNQTPKATYCVVPFVRSIQKRQTHTDPESRLVGGGQGDRQGVRNGEGVFSGYELPFGGDESGTRQQ